MCCRSMCLPLALCLILGLGPSTAAAVEESALLAWADAGEELGAIMACHGNATILGAPGISGPNDRFFLGIFDPQTQVWANVGEAGGSGLTDLAISGTSVAAAIDDEVHTFGWSATSLNPTGAVTGPSPRAVALGFNGSGESLAVGRHVGAFPILCWNGDDILAIRILDLGGDLSG